MKAFLKIGLPWALSLGLVFYLGLQLGSQTSERQLGESSHYHKSEIPNKPKLTSSPSENTKQQIKENSDSAKSSNSKIQPSPPLPPNLIRIMQGSGIIERMGAYLDAVRAMDRSNVQDVVAAFEALPKGYGRHLEMKLLMRSWADVDPLGALAYANEVLDEKSERRFGVSEILAGWANRDPDAALAWAKANNRSENPEDNPLLVGIIKGLAETNLDSANGIFLSLPDGNARWQASSFLAQEYSKKGTQEAIRWANQLPKEDLRLRETILGQLASRLARRDISGTAQWVSSMEDDKASRRVMDNLLTNWVSQDVGQASEWVTALKNEDQKTYAMKQLTARWSLMDPVSTAQWLNQFPPSEKLDPVVGEFVTRISARDPEGAVGWAQSILDPSAKDNAIKKALSAWDRTDPKTASEWRRTNGYLPEK